MDTKRLQELAGILNESWHPDDPAGVDIDDIEDKDPEDFDDISKEEGEGTDYDESSDSESEDTDAMGGINEEEPKGVVINVPENTSYVDLAKAVASELKDGYGKHLYKDFLKALVAELTR